MTTDMGTRLRAARLAAGFSQDEAAYASREYLPRSIRPVGMTISRLENGQRIADQFDIVAALCLVYAEPLTVLAPELSEEYAAVRNLLRKTEAEVRRGQTAFRKADNAGYVTLSDTIVDLTTKSVSEDSRYARWGANPALCLT